MASRRALAAVLALTLVPMLLPALAAAPPPEPVPPPAMPGPPPLAVGIRPDDIRGQARMADELSRGTSADAATFERALTTPAVRAELERVLKRPLPDDALRAMAAQARAESDYWLRYRQGMERVMGAELTGRGRRGPGMPAPPSAAEPIVNPGALPAPQPMEKGGNVPVPDRWRILDALGRPENWLDPYNTSTLKGDKPIFGDDWFFNLEAISDSIYEPARIPVGVAPTYTARPNEHNTFGRFGRILFNQNVILSLDLFQGDTAYKPPELEFKITPVFNFNHTEVGEVGLININPANGTVRDNVFVGLQEAFVDYHIRNVSEYFDFDSFRVGIQPFNSDFRGFLFQDQQLGVRLFGDRDANRWQYNLAYFRRLEKDTNSGLNNVVKSPRKDDVFIVNLFRQDLPVQGFTSQVTYIRNNNYEGGSLYYDENGFLVRPAQIGDNRGYNYGINYLGYNGDGHFGRFNLTTSAYWAIGDISHNQFSPDPQNHGANINGFFAAAEPSMDFDWIRVRLSGLYQSGAKHPQSGHIGGFDAINENPQFAGADTSFWIRQTIPLIGGGGVALNTPNGVLADLRSSKTEGQSNFINPGLFLVGIGTDFDILPELRLSTNFNYLRFATTAPLDFLRHQANIPDSLGYDLSAALTYRPLFSQNVILRLSGSVLLPGDGTAALFNTAGGAKLFGSSNFLFAVLANVLVAY
ncbi:MAG TPA: hypothetical protein VHU15_02040 [Stellaceae bacterium]|nr:hypothetical protein [Stellaceae bacterium]